MVAGQRIAVASSLGVGPFDYVYARPVLLEEIQIHGGEVTEFVAEIPDSRDGFQKNLRHDDGGACVDVDTALV